MSYDLGTAHGTIELEYKGHGAAAAAEKDMDRLDHKSKDTDKSLFSLGKTLGGLGGIAKKAGLGLLLTQAAAGAASLGIQLLGIIPDLVSIASLAAGIPAAIVGIGVSVGILTAAFHGLGDTIKAAFDPKGAAKFNEALKELSPEAQRFAKAVQGSAKELIAFRQSIQETFFQTSFLADQVPRLVKALAGLRPAILDLTGDFGEATRRLTNFALSGDTLEFLNNSIKATRAAFSEIMPAIVPVLIGLRDVGKIGLPLFVRLAELIGNVAQKFGGWLTQIAQSGQLQDWINTAIATLTTLTDIIKNVGSIFFSVIKAASDTGGGLLNVIAEITGQFADFLKSAEGAGAIRDLFSAIMGVAKQLSPVITTLAGSLIKALAPAIAEIAETVGPILLQVVQQLAPAFGPLAKAIADLVVALAPLLPPAAEFLAILAQLASGAVSVLAAELGPLVELLSQGMLQAFQELAPIVTDLAKNALPLAAEAGIQLAQAFAPMIPSLVELATTLADALIPQLPAIQDASLKLIPVVVDLANAFVELWQNGLKDLIPLIPPMVDGFVKLLPLLIGFWTIGLRIVTFLIQFVNFLHGIPAAIGAFASAVGGAIGGALTTAWNFITTLGSSILDWFTSLPGKIVGALKKLPGLVVAIFQAMLDQALFVTGFVAGLIVGAITKLPGRILEGLKALPGLISNLFTSAWNTVKNVTTAAMNALVSFGKSLPGRIKNAISSLGSLIAGVARTAWNAVKSAFNSGISSAVSVARGFPGKIKSAVGNLGSLLASAGRAVMSGLYNGIQSGIDRVVGLARSAAHKVRDAFNAALSIFSPSRVFMESGVNIDLGLIKGIQKKMGEVTRTAQALAQTVIDPTIKLPNVSGLALAGIPALPAIQQAAAQSDTARPDFGPYHLQIDKDTLVSFTIDAINGNPKVVSKAAKEGDRVGSWNGSGR